MRNRAELSIAQGALTNSKRPQTFIDGFYPTHAQGGKGALLHVDKEKYVDYYGALGSNLFGYGNQEIAETVYRRYLNGATLSLSSNIEIELAERLKAIFPSADLWKFGKNGSDVCAAALKIARAYTGRDIVLSDGYHGWADDFISMTPPALGVPKRSWVQSLNDNWDLIPYAAAVIIEPVQTDYSAERIAYLRQLRQECTRHNTLLIFDEIITGFRFPKFSVSNYYGIHPDLILIGKAMGAGLPISAIGGAAPLMNCGEYFYSGTFFGETVSMAASLKAIDMLETKKFDIDQLWLDGQNFLTHFNELSSKLKIVGYPTRGAFQGDQKTKALFWQEACRAKILFGPSWFFNFALAEFTPSVIPVCRDIFNKISMGQVDLEGKEPSTPFAQSLRRQA